MERINIDPSRFQKKSKDAAAHELAACVNLIEARGLITKQYGYGYYLKRVNEAKLREPQVIRLLAIMDDTRRWIKENKGENLNCGAWLNNRLKEMKEQGADHVLAKHSR